MSHRPVSSHFYAQFGIRFIRGVRGDGNCLFRTLSDQLFDTDTSHADIREKVVEEMRENADRYMYFLDLPEYDTPSAPGKNADVDKNTEEDIKRRWETYLQNMAKLGEWGSWTELKAFATAYRCEVRVYQEAQDHVYTILPFEKVEQQSRSKKVHLIYNGHSHYESARGLEPHLLPQDSDVEDGHQITEASVVLPGMVSRLKEILPVMEEDTIRRAIQETNADLNAAVRLLQDENPPTPPKERTRAQSTSSALPGLLARIQEIFPQVDEWTARNALEASGGDLATAVELVQNDHPPPQSAAATLSSSEASSSEVIILPGMINTLQDIYPSTSARAAQDALESANVDLNVAAEILQRRADAADLLSATISNADQEQPSSPNTTQNHLAESAFSLSPSPLSSVHSSRSSTSSPDAGGVPISSTSMPGLIYRVQEMLPGIDDDEVRRALNETRSGQRHEYGGVEHLNAAMERLLSVVEEGEERSVGGT